MLSRWLSSWQKRRARDDRPAAAVYLSAHHVALAAGGWKGDRCALDLCVDPISQPADAAARLRTRSRDMGLAADTACNLVLAPEFYTVSLVERPEVPDHELREAVRWRVQDNLEFPADQAAIDLFALPQSASRERSMVFVVALPMDVLRRLLDKVHSAGIRVATVDVTELALRNVAWGLHPQPEVSVALLRLTPGSGVINISRGDELFLSRRVSGIPAELLQGAWEQCSERLLLQVQRSIDYYESAMGQPPCSALIVASSHGWQDEVCSCLADMLPLPVRTLEDELRNLYDVRLHGREPEDVDWNSPTTGQRDALTAALPAVGGLMRPLGERDAAPGRGDVEVAA